MLDNSLNIRPNEKLTSDLDLAYQKNTKMTYYMPSKIAISKVIFSRWRLAAILDLCKLWELPKVAKLATKPNLF